VAAATLALAAPAGAQANLMTVPIRVTGSVSVLWHGDPARCAFGTACAVDGVLTYHPNVDGSLDFERGPGGLVANGAFGGSGLATGVVRVTRKTSSGSDGVCLDVISPGLTELQIAGVGPRAVLSLQAAQGPLAAGRCAGPTALDLARVVPRARLDLSRLATRDARAVFEVPRPFSAGPYSVRVVSNLHARLRRARRAPDEPDSPDTFPEPAERRKQALVISYRVIRLSGAIDARVAGLQRGCALLDACGLSGDLRYALDVRRGEVALYASRPGRPQKSGLAGLLRALGRGKLALGFDGELPDGASAQLSANEFRDGAPTCSDSSEVAVPELEGSQRGPGLRLSLALAFGADPFRTHCPGPASSTVTQRRPLASAMVTPRELLRRHLIVRLRGTGRFAGVGYSGSRNADVVLELRRTHIRLVSGLGR
jgi:hypothetical protein